MVHEGHGLVEPDTAHIRCLGISSLPKSLLPSAHPINVEFVFQRSVFRFRVNLPECDLASLLVRKGTGIPTWSGQRLTCPVEARQIPAEVLPKMHRTALKQADSTTQPTVSQLRKVNSNPEDLTASEKQ